MDFDFIVIGGGAAGIFAAIQAATLGKEVLVLEATSQLLSKVKISGGGRCNVTHSCFEPKELVSNYPRGSKELLGPFHQFQPEDMVQWLETCGVRLKTEKDGRMFPITDRSETIIEALLESAQKAGVTIRKNCRVKSVKKGFKVELKSGEVIQSEALMLATGSSPSGWRLAKSLGHTVLPQVPSLFTFNVPDSPLLDLSGISVDHVRVTLPTLKRSYEGPILITHWGFSGPAVLKLSAFCAIEMHQLDYKLPLEINWALNWPDHQIPKRLFKRLTHIERDCYKINGKSTNKSEFVTCGGVDLKEINFKTMESKITPGLYFGGEILNIDGITGGFNFQAAWTTGWIAGSFTE